MCARMHECECVCACVRESVSVFAFLCVHVNMCVHIGGFCGLARMQNK